MVILKSDTIKNIKADYNQLFQNKHTLSIGFKEVIKMKDNGSITERDLIITKFLFRFNFATPEQIHQYLEVVYPEMAATTEVIESRMNKLVQYRVLNKFILVEDPEAKPQDRANYPSESLEIFCMDLGGRHLLANYSNEEVNNWYTVETMKTSKLIQKELFVASFYINLRKTTGDRIKFFNINPEMRVGRQSITPSFEFCLDDKGTNLYYVGEIVLDVDMPGEFRSKSINLESLFNTNAWKKYYYDVKSAPPLLIVAESDFIALDASRMFYQMTEINKFRVTTIERMQKPFYETGVFMKYVDKAQELFEVASSKFNQ